ncbi:hypothetical protein M9H77_18160 [Catharanthus roseus]|uniref:Uncharacterized protein n=1 Tax=Catharanthus roseus TaxID=4058 RepID=A0ACC0B6P2_CATRO|nr:hypothetical protein M9H77_18160 [Catharanthus roseus]
MSASLKNKSVKEEQREKEIGVLEKNSSKDEDGKLAYKSIKTMNFFPSKPYLSFEIYFKEMLFSLVFMKNGYQFYFLNSLGTLLEKKHFIEFNSISCAIPRVDECHFNTSNYVFYVPGIEDKGRNMEKELSNFLKDLPISLSLYPSLTCYEVSLVELELFLESYLSHVSIYGDFCAISFGGGLFLVISYPSTCLSSHVFLED